MVLGYLGGPLQNVVYHFRGTIRIKINLLVQPVLSIQMILILKNKDQYLFIILVYIEHLLNFDFLFHLKSQPNLFRIDPINLDNADIHVLYL